MFPYDFFHIYVYIYSLDNINLTVYESIQLVSSSSLHIEEYFTIFKHIYICVCVCAVIAKVLFYGLVVSEFELQPRYYVHFYTNTLRIF